MVGIRLPEAAPVFGEVLPNAGDTAERRDQGDPAGCRSLRCEPTGLNFTVCDALGPKFLRQFTLCSAVSITRYADISGLAKLLPRYAPTTEEVLRSPVVAQPNGLPVFGVCLDYLSPLQCTELNGQNRSRLLQSRCVRMAPVAVRSVSKARVAFPETLNGSSSARLKYLRSIAGLRLLTLTCAMVQLPNWRSSISS